MTDTTDVRAPFARYLIAPEAVAENLRTALAEANTIGPGIDPRLDRAALKAIRSVFDLTDALEKHYARALKFEEAEELAAREAALKAELAELRAARGRTRTKPTTQPAPPDVRDWARANGHTVSVRGKIPDTVQAAYDQAHPEPVPE